MKEVIYGPMVLVWTAQRQNKKAEYFSQNTVAVRKLPVTSSFHVSSHQQHCGEMGRVHTGGNQNVCNR